MSLFKLGKLAPKHDHRLLLLSDYTAKLAPAPASCDLTGKMSHLGMMLNDQIGDCTCATVGHVIQQWTAETGQQVILPDADILSLYEKFGYVPGNESTDNGAVVADVLNYWRKNPVSGHALEAYTGLTVSHVQQLKDSIYYFGNAYLGVDLPVSAQNQDVWDVVSGPDGQKGSWGGHAIPVVAYDETHVVCITWGAFKKMTWAFFEAYCDEAYALLSKDWIEQSTSKCPAGFDLNALLTDLKSITAA